MNNDQVRTLLAKYRTGMLSEEERALLESWYLAQITNNQPVLADEELQQNLRLVRQTVMGQTKARSVRIPYLWRAAAILVLFSAAIGYFAIRGNTGAENAQEIGMTQDVLPGGNKATLTFADGSAVELSTDQSGIVVGDEIKYADGTTVDSGTMGDLIGEGGSGVLVLATPKGGVYGVTLPDGTKVWLNSASKLRYPVRFAPGQRVVELEGEAYFEVNRHVDETTGKPERAVPFVVKSQGQDVTVLGTVFNVSAYADEPTVKTTLITGSVKVAAYEADRSVLLVPGEVAVVSTDRIETRQADMASAVAWQQGKFRFNETELHDVINQLSRWYDLEIEYQGKVPEKYFYGIINRDQTLANVLEVLKEGGVNFKIEKSTGKNKLIVFP